MAFLSSEELIIDATLTDIGRDLISKGDGSFRITQFAPVDTEIDYGLYSVLSDSIVAPADILMTPILEPLTNESANEQYELISIAGNIQYLPSLTGDSAKTIDEFSGGTSTAATISVVPTSTYSSAPLPLEIIDTLYFVYCNNMFLEVVDYAAFLGVDSAFSYAGYAVDADSTVNTNNGRSLTTKIRSKPIDEYTWDIYGNAPVITGGKRTITTIVKVKGAVSGLTKNIVVTINEIN